MQMHQRAAGVEGALWSCTLDQQLRQLVKWLQKVGQSQEHFPAEAVTGVLLLPISACCLARPEVSHEFAGRLRLHQQAPSSNCSCLGFPGFGRSSYEICYLDLLRSVVLSLSLSLPFSVSFDLSAAPTLSAVTESLSIPLSPTEKTWLCSFDKHPGFLNLADVIGIWVLDVLSAALLWLCFVCRSGFAKLSKLLPTPEVKEQNGTVLS